MRLHLRFAIALATLGTVAGATEASADIITQWSFPSPASAPDNSPAPDFGPGTATVLGMDNPNYIFSSNNTIIGTGTFIPGTIYSTGTVASADILATPAHPAAMRTPGGFVALATPRAPRSATVGISRPPNIRREHSSRPAPPATAISDSMPTGSPRPRA